MPAFISAWEGWRKSIGSRLCGRVEQCRQSKTQLLIRCYRCVNLRNLSALNDRSLERCASSPALRLLDQRVRLEHLLRQLRSAGRLVGARELVVETAVLVCLQRSFEVGNSGRSVASLQVR